MYFIALHCNKTKLIETIIIIITIDDIHDDDDDKEMRLLCDIIRSAWDYVYDIHIPGMTDMTDRHTDSYTSRYTHMQTRRHTDTQAVNHLNGHAR